MPKMDLRLPGFTYSACGPFTKNKERIQIFKETGDSRYIYQNELDKIFNMTPHPTCNAVATSHLSLL